jgi:hypothetical protein
MKESYPIQVVDFAEDAFITIHNGVKRWQHTMAGWQLLCQWKDGSINWVALKDMKESYPIQVTDFAKANWIDDEPAFAWWVPDVLKKRECILAKVKAKYWQRTPNWSNKCKRLTKRMVIHYDGTLFQWKQRTFVAHSRNGRKERTNYLSDIRRSSVILCLT